MWSCRLLQCCEPTVEERSAVNPHATFCGSRRRATASGDPVGWETERCRMAQATAPILDSTIASFRCAALRNLVAIGASRTSTKPHLRALQAGEAARGGAAHLGAHF